MEILNGSNRRLPGPAIVLVGVGMAVQVLLPMPAAATEWECGERSNLPLQGKNYCAAGDFRLSESNLIELLDQLLEKHRLAFGDADALQRAQESFESYRDHQCAAENKRIEDKPYHPMVVSQCKTRFTNIRIEELKQLQQQKL